MSRSNFVQVQLASAATDIQTTLSIAAPVGGYKLPPADGGRLTITDSLGAPTKFEVVTYATRTGTGPYTLTGVVRGLEGTVGLAWGAGAYSLMGLTAGELDSLIDGREPAIQAGTSAQLWLGNKTWASVLSQVHGTFLTGLSLTIGTAISATDTVIAGLGKLQKQITDIGANLAGNVRATVLSGYLVGSNVVLDNDDTVLEAFGKIQGQVNARALSNNPTFTGAVNGPTPADGDSSTLYATTAFVQGAIGGYLSKAVTGGTVTLTAAEASNPVIQLAGVLTSNLILQIPVAAKRIYSISNATTGAFTVSIKVVGLTPVVLVVQGKRNLIYTNGVGAYDAINDFDAIALTGVSTCATAALGTNNTQIASTAYTVAEIGNRAPTKSGTGASGSWDISITGSSATCSGLAGSATTLTGLTPTVAELNYMAGVTSNVQSQFNGKAASSHTHSYLPLTGGEVTGLLEVTRASNALKLNGVAAGIANVVYMSFYDSLGVRDGYVGVASNSSRNMYVQADAGDVLIYPSAGRSLLYNAGVVKLATKTTGVDITGNLDVSGVVSQADSGWLTPTLVNSFLQGDEPLRYRKIGTMVYVTGAVKRAAVTSWGALLTTLPIGYRPGKIVHSAVVKIADNLEWGVGNFTLDTAGVLQLGLIGGTGNTNGNWYFAFNFEAA